MITRMFLTLSLLFSLATVTYAGGVPLISPEQLKTSLSDSGMTILDVRTSYDWETSEYKIKGANRAAPEEFESWSALYNQNNRYVLYCS